MELIYEVAEEHLKVLVAALQCLAQVGKELALEGDGVTGELTCRVLNDAHSASGTVRFERAFFADVRVHPPPPASPSAVGVGVATRCKVFARSCCNVFRTLKRVRSLQLAFLLAPEAPPSSQATPPSSAASSAVRNGHAGAELDDDEDDEDAAMAREAECEELRWRLRCDHDVTKTHVMRVHASQIMRAVFDRETCPSRWVARQFHLASLLAHIHHSHEVAVTCSDTMVKFESYVPTTGDGRAHLHTETAVEVGEFQAYTLSPLISQSTDAGVQLIFCLKEVRALLAFCRASDLSEIQFFFSASGSPVLFAAESTSLAKFGIELTLSTVTTFLPVSSQTRSEDEGNQEHRDRDAGVDIASFLRHDEHVESTPQDRYLKRTRTE